VIVMAVCAHQGLAISHYGWMTGVAVIALVRMIKWQRRSRLADLPANPARFLQGINRMALGMIGCLSLWTSYTFSSGLFEDATFPPISLAFGATCIAHCLASSRFTAIGVLIFGILPSAIAMTVSGDFNAGMLGISMISITALMVRFVAEQYDQLIKRLLLEKQNRDQANTDPLTGLANRRAMMAALEKEETTVLNGGAPFGVALLDLDGFKGVNDTFGHPVGDALLQEVALRLRKSVGQIDQVGRLGGDEFIVLFRAVEGEKLCGPVDFGVATVTIAASLGYARSSADGDSIEGLLSCADQALYAAKRSGKAEGAAMAENNARAA
jgi:diguanylate cyclase